jgi:ABC-type transport system involved in cytochrome c biogenesis permease component
VVTTISLVYEWAEPKPLTASRVVKHNLILAWRNLVKFRRNRTLMVLSRIQPLTQMVLFAFVFNSVATVPGIPYKQFVVPGVLVQTVVLAAMRTGVAVSVDLETGMMDRFRTLPIARSAVLVGRTISDTVRMALQTIVLMAISVGVIGFHFREGPIRAAGVVVVIVCFGVALTAFSGFVGLLRRRPRDGPDISHGSDHAAGVHEFGVRSGLSAAELDAALCPVQPGHVRRRSDPIARHRRAARLAFRAVRAVGGPGYHRVHVSWRPTIPPRMSHYE